MISFKSLSVSIGILLYSLLSSSAYASENTALCGEVYGSSANSGGKALLIAVDDYEDPNVSDLKGTLFDACSVRRVLIQKYGFADSNVSVLANSKATEAGIRTAFEGFQNQVSSEDDAVIFYAGHGAQIPDNNKDEADRMDETIVPHDSYRGQGWEKIRDIRDDDLGRYFDNIAANAKSLSVIFDSCHSGTATRSALRPRFLDRGISVSNSLAIAEKTFESVETPRPNFVFISSASFNQTAKEIYRNGQSRGAFTTAFTELLEKRSDDHTLKEIIELANIEIEKSGIKNQNPQIEGAKPGEKFLGGSIINEIEVIDNIVGGMVAKKVSSGRYKIGTGALNGETTGSVYKIVNGSGEGQDAIVVNTAATSSILSVPSSISADQITVSKSSHNYENKPPRFAFTGGAKVVMNNTLASSALSSWVTSAAEQAHFLIDLDETTDDPNDVVVLDADGERLTGYVKSEELVEKMTAWDRWRRFREMDDRSRKSLTKAKFSGPKCGFLSSSRKSCIKPGEKGPKIRVKNRTKSTIYVNFIAVNPTGSIVQSGKPIKLLPKARYTSPALGIIPAEGKKENVIIKVFASYESVDLSAFQQGELKRADSPSCGSADLDELNSLLCSFNGTTRGKTKVNTSNWSVDDLSITIFP